MENSGESAILTDAVDCYVLRGPATSLLSVLNAVERAPWTRAVDLVVPLEERQRGGASQTTTTRARWAVSKVLDDVVVPNSVLEGPSACRG